MTSCTRTSPCWWISGRPGAAIAGGLALRMRRSEQYADTLITGKINYDEEPQLIQRFGIDTIPTLLLFKNGEVIGSVVAPGSKAAIEAFIRETLAQ